MKSLLSSLAARVRAVAAKPAATHAYPAKPVRLIVPYARGGITDVAARLVRGKLEEALGQAVAVDNHPGAGGTIGAAVAARAAPDGYTLLVASSGEIAIAPALQDVRYDALRDFEPISLVAIAPLVIVASSDAPFTNLRELIDTAKAASKPVSYATPGRVGAHHVTGEWLKHLTGVWLVNATYGGGAPAVADVVRGRVPIGVVALTPALPHIRSGKARLIALTSAKRLEATPEWPTVAESGFAGFDTSIWVGLFAPAGTPEPIVMKLNATVNRILRLPDVRDNLAAHGGEPRGGTPAEFAAFIRSEVARYREIIAEAKIGPVVAETEVAQTSS
jgi:tripartite-type tricarboxylate transporter receptor subunit TctC